MLTVGQLVDSDYPYFAARAVVGRVACVLHARSEKRGMHLEVHLSRAIPTGEIHELALTDDPAAAPGVKVDRVAYLGFVEIIQGGVVLAGERLTLAGRELGRVVGFDCTHFPNHMTILVRGPLWQTGKELGVSVEDRVLFSFVPAG